MFGSQKVLPTIPWLSGYIPVTSVKWFGNVKLGKEGVMYFGDTPCLMNEDNTGVRSRRRKSARNPSKEIRIVVGGKSCVPLESVFAMAFDLSPAGPLECDALYAPKRSPRKAPTITKSTAANRLQRAHFDCLNVSVVCRDLRYGYDVPSVSHAYVSFFRCPLR